MQVSNYLSEKVKSFSLLCAGMVVGIHVSGIESTSSAMWWWSRIGHYGIFLISVPFFFTASGFFIAGHFNENGWWRRECLKRFKSLLIPFFIWSAVAAMLTIGMILCANLLHGRELLTNMPNDLRWWSQAFGLYPFAYPSLVPLWYLRTLMIFVIISPVLYYAEKWGARILICIYLLHLILVVTGCGLFMRYTFSLFSLSFFFLGMILRTGGCSVNVENKSITILALIVGIATLGLSFFISDVESRLFWVCRMIFIPCFLFALWNLLPTVKLPYWLSSVAFPIFLLHVLVWRLLSVIGAITHIKYFQFLNPENLAQWGVKWVIGFCFPIIFAIILRRVFPRFSSIVFGGR